MYPLKRCSAFGVAAGWVLMVGVLLLSAPGCAPGGFSPASDEQLQLDLSEQHLAWIGRQVYRNECASRRSCLVHWNRGEAFPSLGIGHFIWYPEGVNGPFTESFPALVSFLEGQGVELPPWLVAQVRHGAPWPDREAFLQAEERDERIEALRRMLEHEQAAQTAFLLQRARTGLEQIASASGDPAATRLKIIRLAETPGGAYALIDYVNFKGEGLAESERYDGTGWGLLQVLEIMELPAAGQEALPAFRQAAASVLTARAQRAENAIERDQWLPGWLKRVETYREPAELP
ncbi:hypothetical protein [Marinobacter sp.]|uniref:hypothetical protein n=1 Tax=Marinobacter sp. TaxID=50741 RepID=UPI003568F261